MKNNLVLPVRSFVRKLAGPSKAERRLTNTVRVISESGLFDTGYYERMYRARLPEGMTPISHYVQIGARNGCNPNPWFDSAFYLHSNPDIAAAGSNPLRHFIEHGWKEMRNPCETAYDLLWHWVMDYATYGGTENPMIRHVAQYQTAPGTVVVRARGRLSADEAPQFAEACHLVLAQEHLNDGALCVIGAYAVENSLWATAEEAFHALILKQPDNLHCRISLADAVEKQGRIWQVAEVLADAADYAPGNAELHFRLGDMQERMGRFAEAAQAFAQAALMRGDVADWHYRHGYALERAGQEAAAQTAYDKAKKLDKKLNSARYGVGVFHQGRGLWRDAVSAYAATVKSRSADPDLWFKLGYAHDRCYDWAKAQHAYCVALSHKFASPYWHYRLGFVLERQEKWREAAGAYRTGADMDTQHRAYWYYRCGYVLENAEAYDEACCAYLMTSKANWDAFKGRGTAAYADWFSQVPDAHLPSAGGVVSDLSLEIADTVQSYLNMVSQEGGRAIHRQSGHAHTFGKLMEARGDWNAAVEAYSSALDLSADHNPAWHRDLGAALIRVGRYQEACRAFRNSRILKRPYGVDTTRYEADKATKASMEYCEYLETLPIRKNTVLYDSFLGASVGCNPYAIFRNIVDRSEFSGWTHIWAINDPSGIPKAYAGRENVIFIPRNSDAYRRYLATSEYLINNSTFPIWFIRREEQKYLNTWHGTPLKAMGKDVRNEFMAYGNITRNFLHATHILSPNQHTSDILIKRHDVDGIFAGKLAETGYPRVDQVALPDESRKRKVQEELGLNPGKPVVLYAPTWRGRMNDKVVDQDRIVADVSAMVGDDYQLVFRGHSYNEAALAGINIPVVIVPQWVDTCDLLSIVDVLVTDYSSILFDFLPAGRPIVYYAYDLEAYATGRGFYLDMAELPGALCTDIEDVRRAIAQGLGQSATKDPAYEQALARFCPFEDGKATERAINFLFFGSDERLVRRYDDPQPSVAMYASAFGPNGITASFLNLLNSLSTKQAQISVLSDPTRIKIDPTRIKKFQAMPESVKSIAYLGQKIRNPEETWITSRFSAKQTSIENQEMQELFYNACAREYRHVFGDMKHHAFVNFDGYNPTIAAMAAASPSTVMKTIYLHNDMIEERNLKWPFLDLVFSHYKKYQNLISVSEVLRRVNRDKIKTEHDIPSNKFKSCENCIDFEGVRCSSLEILGEDLATWFGACNTFLSVGRLSPEKDHAKLIKAFVEVREQHPSARLVIIGDGPLRKDLNLLVDRLDLASSVKLAGALDNPFPAIKACDCFVLSSNHEGQPMVLLEALVLGKPIIATDIDGNRGVLGGQYGELVKNSMQGIRQGMLDFINIGQRHYYFDACEYQEQAMKKFLNIVLN